MKNFMKQSKHIHFVGIGGIGMSGMAELLYNHGFKISGSDLNISDRTNHLKKIGINVSIGHNENNISSSDLIVYSSAVNKNNIEIIKAISLKIPVVRRAELLGEMLKIKDTSIAVAGTHGKTTTSSMIGSIIYEANLEPTLITGGIVNKFESNNLSGDGDIIIVEADEFDKSFLALTPTYITLNNLDLEHLDIYENLEELKETFIQFSNSIPFYGTICIGLDNENLKNILPKINRNYKTYGINNKADVMAKNIKFNNEKSSFDVVIKNKNKFRIKLNVPGLHNVYNALSAITICSEININNEDIVTGLNRYTGVRRRFDIKHSNVDNREIMIIDDYAHHPSEVKSTIDAIKTGWPTKKIISIFQPHLFSRTRDFYKDFALSLSQSDKNIILPIYPARETPIKNVSSEMILEELNNIGHIDSYCIDKKNLSVKVKEIIENNTVILTMGAGDIYKSIQETYISINEK